MVDPSNQSELVNPTYHRVRKTVVSICMHELFDSRNKIPSFNSCERKIMIELTSRPTSDTNMVRPMASGLSEILLSSASVVLFCMVSTRRVDTIAQALLIFYTLRFECT